jgi:hypothetical protein
MRPRIQAFYNINLITRETPVTAAASIVFPGALLRSHFALLCSHFDFHITVYHPRLMFFLSL